MYIDLLSSGISKFISTMFLIPSPEQSLHIPFGELKEKEFGSGLSKDIPVSGQTKFLL